MFKFKCRFELPFIDLFDYRKRVAREITEKLSEAAFDWLNAALAEVPNWSGASRATFLHLSRAIGYSLSVGPEPGKVDRVSLGLRTSEGKFDISQANSGFVSFTYETRLKHLIHNEFNNANLSPDPSLFHKLLKPGPYKFQNAAIAEFNKVASGTELPDWRDSIKKNTRRVT